MSTLEKGVGLKLYQKKKSGTSLKINESRTSQKVINLKKERLLRMSGDDALIHLITEQSVLIRQLAVQVNLLTKLLDPPSSS